MFRVSSIGGIRSNYILSFVVCGQCYKVAKKGQPLYRKPSPVAATNQANYRNYSQHDTIGTFWPKEIQLCVLCASAIGIVTTTSASIFFLMRESTGKHARLAPPISTHGAISRIKDNKQVATRPLQVISGLKRKLCEEQSFHPLRLLRHVI